MNNNTNYILKLKALLHDPIHKIWSFENVQDGELTHSKEIKQDKQKHEKIAEDLFRFLLSEDIDDNKIKIADEIASGLSRIVVAPQLEKNERENFNNLSSVFFNEAKYIEPFSGIMGDIGYPQNHQEVKNIFEKLGALSFNSQEERAKFYFFFLWRFLPDIFPWIEKHPADSRTPNHSIYDHLVQTSSIATCLENDDKPAFLLFTITPVQSFIETARKTSDLWAGSYLLSYLIYKSIETIITEYGPDHIIFPNLKDQPLLDLWLYNKFFKDKKIKIEAFKKWLSLWSNYSSKNSELTNKLTIANFPNRFLAILPYSKAKDIAKRCIENIGELIDELIDKIPKEEAKTQINRIKSDIISYLKPYWVVVPFYKDSYTDVDTIINEYKNLIGKNENVKTIEIIKNHPYYKNANVGNAYSLIVELTERFLASRKMLKDFVNISPQTKEKCHLCGEYDIVNLKWQNLSSKYYVNENERLCGVCLLKRFLPEIMKQILSIQTDIKYPSTSEMATVKYKLKIDKKKANKFFRKFKEISSNKIPESISVPALKENSLYNIDGQWLMESSYRKEYLKKEFGIDVDDNNLNEMKNFLSENNINPPTYYAILALDGDNMGKWLNGEFLPNIEDLIHPKTKEAISNLNNTELTELLQKQHPMSPSLHNQFSRKLSFFALNRVREIVEKQHYGKLIYAGGDDVLAFLPVEDALDCAYKLNSDFKNILGEKASMSAGIVFVHHKYPLSLALDEVREAEKQAKNRYGRNAFCIKYISGSGEERITGNKWDKKGLLKEIISKYIEEELSSKFAYDFMEVIKELTSGRGKIENVDILKNELKRIYRHKLTKDKYDKEFEEKLIDEIENFKENYEDFANMLIIARFISKFEE